MTTPPSASPLPCGLGTSDERGAGGADGLQCGTGHNTVRRTTAGSLVDPRCVFERPIRRVQGAKQGARAPIVELVISSTLDDTLAPPGQHVASLFCQHVHPDVDGGWDAHRDTVARLMIDTVDAQAPNFRASVLGYEALSPLDLERRFGLVGGDIFHGSLGLDQLFAARPLLGQGNYRGALPGLYLCGSGTHPGGGVTGLPGRNAAREIARDLGRRMSG